MTPPLTANNPSPMQQNPMMPGMPSNPGDPAIKAPEVNPFEKAKVLDGILKKTGRLPTHPLLSNPNDKDEKPEEIKVTPAQAQKAESFRLRGQTLFKQENFEKALEFYQKAYEANPTDPNIVLGFALSAHATGDALKAHELYNEFLETNPEESDVRNLRMQLNAGILEKFKEMAPQIPEDKREGFSEVYQMVSAELTVDQALGFAQGADKTIENFREVEKTLEGMHDKTFEEKAQALQSLFGDAVMILGLTQAPIQDPEKREEVTKELDRIGKEVLGGLVKFVDADSEPRLKELKPLLEGYAAAADGRQDDALKSFLAVRDAGFKSLGGGDAVKGEKIFRKKIYQAKKFLAENKPEEVEKLGLNDLPVGLMSACDFLKPYDDEKSRKVSMAILDAWEENLNTQNSDVSLSSGDFSKKFQMELAAGKDIPSAVADILKNIPGELALIEVIRKRLTDGKAGSIKEALQDIIVNESGDLKDQAMAVQKRDVDTEDSSLLGVLIRGSDRVDAIHSSVASGILAQATQANIVTGCPKMAKVFYTIVSLRSEDQAQRDQAEAALK